MNVDLVKQEFQAGAGSRSTFVSAQLFDKDRRLEIVAKCHCRYCNGKPRPYGISGVGKPISDDELPSLTRRLVEMMLPKAA